MSSTFQDKTIKFIAKSDNPAAVDVLVGLLENSDSELQSLGFEAIYVRRDMALYPILFDTFQTNPEGWMKLPAVNTDRLSKIADIVFRGNDVSKRQSAAQMIQDYRLYETLPSVITLVQGADAEATKLAVHLVIALAEGFYDDLVKAPSDTERRNLDRRREWFVQQMDPLVKSYAVHKVDDLLRALLLVTKKEYQTFQTVMNDHRSAACKKIAEMLATGEHGSYVRVLLGFIGDANSPPVIDEILTTRSDPYYVRKMLDYIGTEPSSDLKTALKRLKGFSWLTPKNQGLAQLIEGLEPNAIQLFASISLSKDESLKLYRYFFQHPSPLAHRAAAECIRKLVGDDVNSLLLEFLNDPDPEAAAAIYKILKARNVKELETQFLVLAERDEPIIKQTLYDAIPDLHVETFASRINHMSRMSAKRLGQYVRKLDPKTFQFIADEIMSPIPIKKIMACDVAAVTGHAPDVEARLIEIALDDDDSNVRIAAIKALSEVLTKTSVEYLKVFMNDQSMNIRDAAALAMKDWMANYQAAFGGAAG